jgi:hypothetical protein
MANSKASVDTRTKAERALCNALSFAWSRSYLRFEALRAAKVGPNQYRCAGCKKIFKLREVQVDHIKPKIPVTGWDNIQAFVLRLLCDPKTGLQVLCEDKCHATKSKTENEERRKRCSN